MAMNFKRVTEKGTVRYARVIFTATGMEIKKWKRGRLFAECSFTYNEFTPTDYINCLKIFGYEEF